MSFDEYVNHISQKYRLAVAISVIKTKPNDLTIEEYLTELKNKINMDDPDETICSDDFKFDDDENDDQVNGQAKSDDVTAANIDFKSNDNATEVNGNEIIVNDSQNSETILNDFVFGDDEAATGKETSVIDAIRILKETNKCTAVNEQPISNLQNLSQSTFCESQEELNIYNLNDTFHCAQVNSNKANNITDARPTTDVVENNIDTQETQLYSLQGFSQDYTHFSQTQSEEFHLSNRYIRNKDVRTVDNETQYYNDREIIEMSSEINQMVYENANTAKHKDVPNIEKCVKVTDNIDVTNDSQVAELNKESNTIEIDEVNAQNIDEYEMEVDDKSDEGSQAVVVPFKVLEELNRVKKFLNGRDRRSVDGYSTDSGYRSDSQLRNSLKSLSQNTSALNQSAHCLFNHIMTSPTGSDDIINDISQVLGRLIDKLHEEENYPTFLEEILETVDVLIRRTHEGCNWADNVLITKDEDIQRLILLNKSKHILEHSIETISNILEKLHTNLIEENLYELTNITEIENMCYIFHILEIFIRRYIKLKNNSSQNTQDSQEDRFPKRSSLTELWRKKWNPNYKDAPKSQEIKTVCVLKRCSEILNKIIVECMDGYSLVAFAALQCFNLMQS